MILLEKSRLAKRGLVGLACTCLLWIGGCGGGASLKPTVKFRPSEEPEEPAAEAAMEESAGMNWRPYGWT